MADVTRILNAIEQGDSRATEELLPLVYEELQLFAVARDHIERQRDFDNDKKLLGVMKSKDGREVLTLVNLRRRFAPTNFGDIGGEWDRELGRIVEPWRLSVWRWKYDQANQTPLFSSRGTFDHSSPGAIAHVYLDIVKSIKPDLSIIDFSIGIEGDGPTTNVGGTI